ncbi:NADPH oxidase 4 isoform X2 [Anabrus simplex]|uniref:NADPH oxidase 4 isoform X2 n=1 Tax=Anabrus simplex TaxID=316456 RepID=UPI0035A2AF0E
MAGGWSRCAGRLRVAFVLHWLPALWFAVNFAIFWWNYTNFKKKPQHIYLRSMIGRGLCISKATAAMLNLSCCLVLLPVCRSVSCALHHILGRLSRSALTFWLERTKVIHMACAVTIVIASVHTIAHVINAINFSRYYDHEHLELNWAKYEGQNPVEMIFSSVAGLTGVAMVLVLTLLASTSLRCVRRAHYQLFWATHFLFLPFLLLLLCHPLSEVLKELANPDTHVPGCIMMSKLNGTDTSEKPQCTSDPVFIPMKSQGWLWITPPLILYGLDQLLRLMRRNRQHLYVVQATRLPGSAVHLVLESPGRDFNCQPGQFILLQCPIISTIEWHPFTVSSCPTSSQPNLSILIRARGDWTEELLGRVLVPFSHTQHTVELCRWPSPQPVRFLVDGPFRSPLEGVLHTAVAVCIAAGVGITPFSAALDHLLTCSTLPERPQHLHLVWLLRDPRQLVWFADLLCAVHKKLWFANYPDRLEFRIHLTRGFRSVNLENILEDKHSILRQRLWRGRPNWIEMFHQWRTMYHRQAVSVFACGPKSLSKEIRKHCIKSNQQGASFSFTHEAYS